MSLPTPPSPMPGSAPRQRASSSRTSPMEGRSHSDNARTLTVHSGITIRGVIENIERLVVKGTVEVEQLSVKEIIITPEGHFRGTAEAGSAEIGGMLEGQLTVRNTLSISASGRLLGDTECRRLQVEEGGQVTGKLSMITSPLPSSKEPATAQHETHAQQSSQKHRG